MIGTAQPHPDTARADATERILADILIRSGSGAWPDVTGVATWWTDWQAKHDRVRRLAELTARRDRERAALAATERELKGLTR